MTHDWQALLNLDIKNFIHHHENDDVRELALKKPPHPDWPYPLILDQIKARQKAKTKIPAWLEHEDVTFPASDTLEQASSQATARYKASLFKGKNVIDLTGGAGIDSWAMLENFETATIIDSDQNASRRIEHNMQILNNKTVSVENTTAEDFVASMSQYDLAIIDPQRRNQSRKGVYKLEECSPDILTLLPSIKAKTILVKTSPMLDIDQGIKQLGCVRAVHVIEWNNECKELLFTLTPESQTDEIPITAVKINNEGIPLNSLTFTRQDEQNASLSITEPEKYLYEPGPAFMKAGGYKIMAQHHNATKIHPHTHLYTSSHLINDFPGRSFEIIDTYPAQAKNLPVKKASLAVRNFPQDVKTLKNKLKLKDGDKHYLFACTIKNPQTNEDRRVILHCHRK